jgi:hypothetical protein
MSSFLFKTTWTLTESKAEGELGAEMMCTAPAIHHVEIFTNVAVALRYLDVDRRLSQASCHAAEGEVGG